MLAGTSHRSVGDVSDADQVFQVYSLVILRDIRLLKQEIGNLPFRLRHSTFPLEFTPHSTFPLPHSPLPIRAQPVQGRTLGMLRSFAPNR